MGDFDDADPGEPAVEMVGDFAAALRWRRTVLRSSFSSRAIRRRDHPRAANSCIVFCSCTLRILAIVPADMPSIEDSAQPYRLLKVRNLESSKRDHFRPDPVPFDRPMTGMGLRSTVAGQDERCPTSGRI